MGGACRQNEDLEQESAAMQAEKARLQQEADKLAQRLQTLLSEKFVQRGTFDAETPIDKTLGYLQSAISVSCARIVLEQHAWQESFGLPSSVDPELSSIGASSSVLLA